MSLDDDSFEIDEESDRETPLIPLPPQSSAQLDALEAEASNPCSGYDPARIPHKTFIQKNELRHWPDLWPMASSGYWFSFQFKIDGQIEPCGSMRWVGGQFKAGNLDNSPFIAQRFDNGIFHITIEAPHHTEFKYERIIIAKAVGNPDLGSERPLHLGRKYVTCDYSSGYPAPPDCGFRGKVNPTGEIMPSIKGGKWIQMDYYVKLGGPCNHTIPELCPRQLEVWADEKKITHVSGRFGAVMAHEAKLKFKIGVYRDFQAGNAGLVIDHFTLRPDPDRQWNPTMDRTFKQ